MTIRRGHGRPLNNCVENGATCLLRPDRDGHSRCHQQTSIARVPVRSGRDAHRQRLPARHRLARGTVPAGHRPVGVADPPADRDERRPVRLRPAPGDRPDPVRCDITMLQLAHQEEYLAQADSVRPLPGAADLLAALTKRGVQWAIATSGYRATAGRALGMLGLPEDAPMITRDMVRHAKPDPDLFLAAAALLDVDPKHAYVVGDSVGDRLAARRAGSIGIGLMSGGYGREELERAGAYRVYADPADMLARADELGVRDLGP